MMLTQWKNFAGNVWRKRAGGFADAVTVTETICYKSSLLLYWIGSRGETDACESYRLTQPLTVNRLSANDRVGQAIGKTSCR